LIPVFDRLIEEGYPDYEFGSSEIEDFLKERIKELITPVEEIEVVSPPELPIGPRKMRIGTDAFEIRNSYEILINAAEWLIRKGKLKRSDCPVPSGHKRHLINLEPKHRYGDDFRAPKRLSSGLWLETHYNTAACIRYARRLLDKFGYRGDMLEVQ